MFRIATAAYSCCPLCSDSSRSCASCSLTAPMQAPSSTTVPPQRCAVWWSRLSNALMAPRALSSNPSVGSLSAPLPGSIAAGGSPRTGKTATTMHSPSSASPPSASCSDGSVILHEVFGRTLRNLNSRLGRKPSPHSQGRVMERLPTAPSFVGVDVSKDRLDVHILPTGQTLVVQRNEKGFEDLISELRK